MKEAFGGVFSLMLVAVFLVLAIGLLGFVVSYTKAFKMKNAIISTIEEYEGAGCYPEGLKTGVAFENSACQKKIYEEAQNLNYNPPAVTCPAGFESGARDLYCYKISNESSGKVIFTVITRVDVGFALMKNIFGWSIFQVGGDTKAIKLRG